MESILGRHYGSWVNILGRPYDFWARLHAIIISSLGLKFGVGI